jgi:serine/threonine-protein kinase HipA
MTSENTCYVYIVLPGETEFVTAGKFILSETPAGDKVGRFVYGKSYLARSNAVPIDPIALPLHDSVFETGRMGGMFGAIRDASPDLWGRILIERRLERTDVSEMEYLLHAPDDRIGALGFGPNVVPPAPMQKFNCIIDLGRLQNIADSLVAGIESMDSRRAQVEELLLIGTSMGGARPKVMVSAENALWIAKLNHFSDRWDAALAEHAMLRLAHDCGIHTAESKVVKVAEKNILLVKRFDRDRSEDGFFRHRMISALTVLRTDDSAMRRDKWSYILLSEELRRLSAEPRVDSVELFRRMVFNALVTNTDDHPRNHAFIARDAWRLAPAYDLTPFPMVGTERRDLAMVCGAQGRFANKRNLLSECRRFMLDPAEAGIIIDTMTDYITNNWHRVAKSVGLTDRDCDLLRSAFVYPGFLVE